MTRHAQKIRQREGRLPTNIPSETTAGRAWRAITDKAGHHPPLLDHLRAGDVGLLVEIPAAILRGCRGGVPLMGVIWRYAAPAAHLVGRAGRYPSSWLAMLGSVIAFHRGEHDADDRGRRNALSARRALHRPDRDHGPARLPSPRPRPVLRVRLRRGVVTTPALEIANSCASALPVCIALMIVVGFLRLFTLGTVRDALAAPGSSRSSSASPR